MEDKYADKFSEDNLKIVFNTPVNTENIFVLLTILKSSNKLNVNKLFKLFIDVTTNRDLEKSPELLASWGIYFSMILRYNPDTEYYSNDKHFLLLMFNSYKPYISLYISFFLLISILRNTDISKPAFKGNSVSIISHLISLCDYNTSEHKSLSDLKRNYTSNKSMLVNRLGLKRSKNDLAIFMDDTSLLEKELSEDEIMKAIFMHSNNVLVTQPNLHPSHFSRALESLNLDVLKRTLDIADWISVDSFDNFLHMCKVLKHPQCLDMLLIAVTRNINLCRHHIKKIPKKWIERIIETYTKPRWMVSESKSTEQYYIKMLCLPEGSPMNSLKELYQKLTGKEGEVNLENFLYQIEQMNKSYFILDVSNYCDYVAKDKTEFANLHDSLLNDIFRISRNFIVVYRQGRKVFLYSYNDFKTIINGKLNFYDRGELPENFVERVKRIDEEFKKCGFGDLCLTMDEFIYEFINGRSIDKDCCCIKNYQKKLVRELNKYGIKEESFEWINIDDIVLKFKLISLNLQAENIKDLCQKLYNLIRKENETSKEEMRRTISNIILLYSKNNAGFLISI